MKRYSKLTTALAVAALTAGCNATVENPDYAKCMARTPAPEPGYCAGMFPPRPARGVDGITAWIDQNLPLLIVVGLAVIAVAVWSHISKEKAQQEQQRESATLARGRRIAENWHATRVAAARFDAAAQVPDRSVFDPHGLGLAPPPAPAPKPVKSPPMSDADLRRYAEFGAVVPWQPGTAFAAVVAQNGSIAPAHAAWAEAMHAANLGETDPETGEFTPAAALVQVVSVVDSGDAELHVRTAGLHVREEQLNRVRTFLVPAARVGAVSPFVWVPTTGLYATTLSMDTAATGGDAKTTTPEPEQPRVDPRWS